MRHSGHIHLASLERLQCPRYPALRRIHCWTEICQRETNIRMIFNQHSNALLCLNCSIHLFVRVKSTSARADIFFTDLRPSMNGTIWGQRKWHGLPFVVSYPSWHPWVTLTGLCILGRGRLWSGMVFGTWERVWRWSCLLRLHVKSQRRASTYWAHALAITVEVFKDVFDDIV
jgi:hypothetical protein